MTAGNGADNDDDDGHHCDDGGGDGDGDDDGDGDGDGDDCCGDDNERAAASMQSELASPRGLHGGVGRLPLMVAQVLAGLGY